MPRPSGLPRAAVAAARDAVPRASSASTGRSENGTLHVGRSDSGSGAVLLEAEGLSKTFGATRALREAAFSLAAGEVHAIVGENGAGKSTFVKIVAGLQRPDAGALRVLGDEVTVDSPAEAEALGISVIHQELSLVPHLTVAQNLVLGHTPTHANGLARALGIMPRGAAAREAADALASFETRIPVDAPAGTLSASEMQQVLIARALHRKMRILILDEPTSALTAVEREDLFRRLRALVAAGVGIIYISHHLDEVLEIADRVTVFRDGQVVGTRSTTSLSVPDVIELMLDRPLSDMYPRKPRKIEDVALEVRGLVTPTSPDGVALQVRHGEIVGLTGLVGAGKTEIARAIVGAGAGTFEALRVGGNAVQIDHPSDALRAGIALVPENRATQGVLPQMSIRDNVSVQQMSHRETRRSLQRGGLIVWSRVANAVRRIIADFGIRADGPAQNIRTLSGGNQQKVVLGRAFSTRPTVVILDEPTRGVDVGSKFDVYSAIQDLAKEGTAILMVSSEFEEVAGMCDRIVVMRKGAVVAEHDHADVSHELLMRDATSARSEAAA